MNKKLPKARSVGRVNADEILPEYDFSHAKPNKYAARYASLQEKSQRTARKHPGQPKGRRNETQ
jgi:hypothetical protein